MSRKFQFSFLLATLFVFSGAQNLNAQTIITTFAGNGTSGFAGDGGQATAAQINRPTRAVADSSGNTFIADLLNDRIRKVDATGLISTFVGTGVAGFTPDGSPASTTQINGPHDLAFDKAGLLIFTDSANNRVRKVDGSGKVVTIAGIGTAGPNGDGGDATAAQLNDPRGIAYDTAGNLYIADYENHKVRMVGIDGKISTVAGNGTMGDSGDNALATGAQLNHPRSVAVDASGNLFIADADNNKIRKVDGVTKFITTLVGNGTSGFSGDSGPAKDAQVAGPRGVAVDSSGNLLIADSGNHRVRRVDLSQNITTIVGTGTAGFSGDGGDPLVAQLDGPNGVAMDSKGNLYISEFSSNRIRIVGSTANLPQNPGGGNNTNNQDPGGNGSCQLNANAGSLNKNVSLVILFTGLVILLTRRVRMSKRNSY